MTGLPQLHRLVEEEQRAGLHNALPAPGYALYPGSINMPNLKMTQHYPHGDYQQLREEYELPIEHF
jgi:hypothetical protein